MITFSIFQPKFEPGLEPSFPIHNLVPLSYLLLDLASCRIRILSSTFLSLISCFSIFDSKWMQSHHRGIQLSLSLICVFVHDYKLRLTLFSAHMFLFCFYPWPYTLNIQTCSCKSIAVHIFCNLFWKICPLFGQILITCLKCSRASFLPSSYNEKMHWGQGWQNKNMIYNKIFQNKSDSKKYKVSPPHINK